MTGFAGFSEGKVRLVPVPGAFFHELLPQIDHIGELKLTLYAFWRLDQMEGSFRCLRREDFLNDKGFINGLATESSKVEKSLDEALQRAVQRGTLITAVIPIEDTEEILYFLNTPRGRAAVLAIERGEWRPSGTSATPVELGQETPNIFRLYEENIGPLTPMIAEALRDAEQTYPADWIAEAFRIAVENNKRNWRYAQAILNRWQEGGSREERKDRRDTEKARRRYTDWEDSGD